MSLSGWGPEVVLRHLTPCNQGFKQTLYHAVLSNPLFPSIPSVLNSRPPVEVLISERCAKRNVRQSYTRGFAVEALLVLPLLVWKVQYSGWFV